MHTFIKLFLACLIFSLALFNTANAQSNDPLARVYITKPSGDMSNCGPIAALMLSKYSRQISLSNNLKANIQRLRKSIQRNPTSNRWWNNDDIKKYFSQEGIKYSSMDIKNKYTIKNQLDKHGIAIINVNMNNLSRGKAIGKPYSTFPFPGGWGHYLVVVGYKQVGKRLLFEIHDSYIKGGNNRLYDADEIQFALKRYNPEILVVRP